MDFRDWGFFHVLFHPVHVGQIHTVRESHTQTVEALELFELSPRDVEQLLVHRGDVTPATVRHQSAG